VVKQHSDTLVKVVAAAKLIGGILTLLDVKIGAYILISFLLLTLGVIHNPAMYSDP
jgi:uncharacterized membrane protein YphA (DoxX/SURF4 family)